MFIACITNNVQFLQAKKNLVPHKGRDLHPAVPPSIAGCHHCEDTKPLKTFTGQAVRP